jgi:hypothetical protein
VVGAVVFGAVTAFATGFPVTSTSIVSGNGAVQSCESGAAVRYSVAWNADRKGYAVAQTRVTTASRCQGMAYRVMLSGDGQRSLGEVEGNLGATGAASPDFSSLKILAAEVTGISVTVTG